MRRNGSRPSGHLCLAVAVFEADSLQRHVGPVRHTPGMGRRNRERRMAKQKQRRRSAADREHRLSDIGPGRAHIIENLVIAMSTAASSPGAGSAVELVEQCHGLRARTRRRRRPRGARGHPSGVGVRTDGGCLRICTRSRAAGWTRPACDTSTRRSCWSLSGTRRLAAPTAACRTAPAQRS